MVVEIAASKRALDDPRPLEFASEDALVVDTLAQAFVGFDLSGLGVQPAEIPGEYGVETTLVELNYPRLLAAVNAALSGDVDFVSLDRNFHLDPRHLERVASLDSLNVARRIVPTLGGVGGVCLELPFDREQGLHALADFVPSHAGQRTASVRLSEDTDFALFAEFSDVAHENGVRLLVIIDDEDYLRGHLEKVAQYADAVRLKVKDPHQLRSYRFTLREMAAARGRDIRVYIEFGIVISATLQAAEERAALISVVTHEPLFDRVPFAVGTVYDVADVVEKWISMGAADGVIFIPASMPTDLASILRGVIPLMKERSRMERGQLS